MTLRQYSLTQIHIRETLTTFSACISHILAVPFFCIVSDGHNLRSTIRTHKRIFYQFCEIRIDPFKAVDHLMSMVAPRKLKILESKVNRVYGILEQSFSYRIIHPTFFLDVQDLTSLADPMGEIR